MHCLFTFCIETQRKKIDIRIIPPLYTKVVFNSLYIVTIIQSKRIFLWIDIQNLGYSLKAKPKSPCIVLNSRKRWGVHNVLLFISIVKLTNYLPVEHLFRKNCQQKFFEFQRQRLWWPLFLVLTLEKQMKVQFLHSHNQYPISLLLLL